MGQPPLFLLVTISVKLAVVAPKMWRPSLVAVSRVTAAATGPSDGIEGVGGGLVDAGAEDGGDGAVGADVGDGVFGEVDAGVGDGDGDVGGEGGEGHGGPPGEGGVDEHAVVVGGDVDGLGVGAPLRPGGDAAVLCGDGAGGGVEVDEFADGVGDDDGGAVR